MSVYELVRFQSNLRPDSVAVITPEAQFSYRELLNHVHSLASNLLSSDVRNADLVALDLPTSYLHLVLIHALDFLNVCSVSLSLTDAQQYRWITQHKNVLVLSSRELRDSELSSLHVTGDWCRSREKIQPGPHSDQNIVVRVVLSSGTSGAPKGVPFTRRMQLARMQASASCLGICRASRVINFSFQTSHGNTHYLAALATGGAVVLGLPKDGLSLMERTETTHMSLSPSWLERLLRMTSGPAPRLKSLQCLEVTGSHLPPALAAQALAVLTPNIYVTYGTTEIGRVAFGHAAMLLSDAHATGYLAPGVQLRAFEASTHRVLEPGQVGTLYARSDRATDRRYGEERPDEVDHIWIQTQDRGSIDTEGIVRVHERVDDVIDHGGLKISPLLIENCLRCQPFITDAAAFAVTSDIGIPEPWAAVVVKGEVDVDALRAALQQELGPSAPRRLLAVPQLPRNRNGKVIKEKLIELVQKPPLK